MLRGDRAGGGVEGFRAYTFDPNLTFVLGLGRHVEHNSAFIETVVGMPGGRILCCQVWTEQPKANAGLTVTRQYKTAVGRAAVSGVATPGATPHDSDLSIRWALGSKIDPLPFKVWTAISKDICTQLSYVSRHTSDTVWTGVSFIGLHIR
jgi:hypothetical protein